MKKVVWLFTRMIYVFMHYIQRDVYKRQGSRSLPAQSFQDNPVVAYMVTNCESNSNMWGIEQYINKLSIDNFSKKSLLKSLWIPPENYVFLVDSKINLGFKNHGFSNSLSWCIQKQGHLAWQKAWTQISKAVTVISTPSK